MSLDRYLVHSKDGFVDFHWEESDDEDEYYAVEDILELCHCKISNPRYFSIDVGDWGDDADEEDYDTVKKEGDSRKAADINSPMLESLLRVWHHFSKNEILWKTLDLHSVQDRAVASIGRLVETASLLCLFREMELSVVSSAHNMDGILSGIEHNQRLERLELHIQARAFSEADGYSLERLLTTTRKLRTLRICGVRNLRLDESLCRGLAANKTLTVLSVDLSSAGASDESSPNLFTTLATHPSLQFLEIAASNYCDELFVRGLNILLSFSSTLEHLSLSNFHKQGKLTLEDLQEGLKQNRSLKVIETYSALHGETNLSTIFQLLPECPKLERLYFYERCIEKQDLENIKGMKRLHKPVILFLSVPVVNYLSKTIQEVLGCHPEIQLIAHHDCGEAGKSLKLLCDLNLHGRYLLDRSPNDGPLSLWPHVLRKCSTKTDVLYFFLKGPAFAAR